MGKQKTGKRKVRKAFGSGATHLGGKVQISRESDSADPDLLPYVDKLMSELKGLKPLDQISLLTQEDALQALGMIDETLQHLNTQLGVARSLRQMLESKKRDDQA